MFAADHQSSEAGMDENRKAMAGNVNEYLRWNFSVFPMKPGKRILEIGCGPGGHFEALLEWAPKAYLGTDYSQEFLRLSRQRIAGRSNWRVEHLDILSLDFPGFLREEKWDLVICFDVLEHLADEILALKNIHGIMTATGAGEFFIRVPALPWLLGENDKAIGHFRRYTKRSLSHALKRGGFRVKEISYQNIAGVLPWFMIGRVLKRKLAVAPSEGKVFDSLVPFLRKFEELIPIPLGLSVFAVATPTPAR